MKLPPLVPTADLAADLLAAVNRERVTFGVPSVTTNRLLTMAALEHSRDMAEMGKLEYFGSNGRTVGSRLDWVGYRWHDAGDIIGGRWQTAEAFVAAIMKDTPRRRTMLDQKYTEMGGAVTRERRRRSWVFWCAVLATPWQVAEPTP